MSLTPSARLSATIVMMATVVIVLLLGETFRRFCHDYYFDSTVSGVLGYRLMQNRGYILKAGTMFAMLFRVVAFSVIGILALGYVSDRFRLPLGFPHHHGYVACPLHSSLPTTIMGHLICSLHPVSGLRTPPPDSMLTLDSSASSGNVNFWQPVGRFNVDKGPLFHHLLVSRI